MSQGPSWFGNGLRFSCTQCGNCCTMEGYVWVDSEERSRLAEHLELSLPEFDRRYLRIVRGRTALIDRSDGACIFWDEGCTVYPARPGQCGTFPFWKENLATPEAWAETAEECEGIGDGDVYSSDEIERMVDGVGETRPALPRSAEQSFDSSAEEP